MSKNLFRQCGLLAMVVVPMAACWSGSAGAASVSGSGAWPVNWCKAQPGISKQQLVSVMGRPTSEFPSAMTWSDHHYQFNAFLDDDGTVKELDINEASLSAAEIASLPCKNTRTPPTQAAHASTAHASSSGLLSACELVTQAEMSTILAAAVVAQTSGLTRCTYKTGNALGPHVEFTLDRGDGAAAMAGAGAAGRREAGLTSRFDGIGDQAVAVGPELLIRTGDDLVTLVFSGVANTPVMARKIFETAKAKM